MPCIVNGEVREKKELGFVSSIVAFIMSVYAFIVDFIQSIFTDQKPTSTYGGAYTVKAPPKNKWSYNPRDFREGGLSRRIGSVQQQQAGKNLPGCSSDAPGKRALHFYDELLRNQDLGELF
ncbi:hypothetical protein WA538_004376 [Blastocystis sp. DL]